MKLYKCDACGKIIEADRREAGLYAYDLCEACKVKERSLNPREIWLDAIKRAHAPAVKVDK